MRLVSACLLGVNCRYDGASKLNENVLALSRKETLIPVCPEQLGGLPTPRLPSGIASGTGVDVIAGRSSVRNADGEDVTECFTTGAAEVLRLASMFGIREAVLKQGSPSCGSGQTQCMENEGGSYLSHPAEGDGVTAALLKRNGVRVITEEDL